MSRTKQTARPSSAVVKKKAIPPNGVKKAPAKMAVVARTATARLRHKQPFREAHEELRWAYIRKLARKGGVKRLSKNVYEPMSRFIIREGEKLLLDARVITEHMRRSTITVNDLLLAMRDKGVRMYGADAEPRKRKSKQQTAADD